MKKRAKSLLKKRAKTDKGRAKSLLKKRAKTDKGRAKTWIWTNLFQRLGGRYK
jgi:hypothetical protein